MWYSIGKAKCLTLFDNLTHKGADVMEYRKYTFSSINPNTNKKVFFDVEAKSYHGAAAKAVLITKGHSRLRHEGTQFPDTPKKGKRVDGLASKLNF